MHNNLFLVIFHLYVISGLYSSIQATPIDIIPESGADTIIVNQALYNGRIWRDLYGSVKEDQFLFSNEFLPGQVTMNGKTFNTPKLRYDILNDEIMTVTDKGHILQLNKEMVDNFTLTYLFNVYNFTKSETDTLKKESAYFNVLHNGRSSLYIRYYKEISKRGPGKNYEDFVQAYRVYIVKNGIYHQVRNNRDFKKILSDKKDAIKAYLKENRILISRKSPGTYVPVLKFYDTLK